MSFTKCYLFKYVSAPRGTCFSFGVSQVIDSAYELKDSTLHRNAVLSLELHWGKPPSFVETGG